MTPVLLDISRTVSRAPYPVPTGIDRVERAYIDHFLASPRPVRFLTRIFQGYALLDRDAMAALRPALFGTAEFGRPDLVARLFSRKKHPQVKRAESDIRRTCTCMARLPGLGRMLGRNLPDGFSYLNVGHSNRHAGLWEQMRGATRRVAMIHDVIPLDYPQYTRPDIATRFEAELYQTARACDRLVCNSTDTRNRTAFWLDKQGIEVAKTVALLGVDPLPPVPRAQARVPAQFVVLGTIEPRKNHALLLDVWEMLAQALPDDQMPTLHIVGRRGWQNEAVFARLDQHPRAVIEHGNMDDAALAALLAQAGALLFPTFAEGFGYPLIEAIQTGIPVLASDLPCFREIARDIPTYLDPNNPAAWRDAILDFDPKDNKPLPELSPDLLGWEKHFSTIEKIL